MHRQTRAETVPKLLTNIAEIGASHVILSSYCMIQHHKLVHLLMSGDRRRDELTRGVGMMRPSACWLCCLFEAVLMQVIGDPERIIIARQKAPQVRGSIASLPRLTTRFVRCWAFFIVVELNRISTVTGFNSVLT